MNHPHTNDPLHGVTLETIVRQLVDRLGWDELGRRIEIRCFTQNPSVKSSLTFLRKTPWARTKVEQLFVRMRARHPGPPNRGNGEARETGPTEP